MITAVVLIAFAFGWNVFCHAMVNRGADQVESDSAAEQAQGAATWLLLFGVAAVLGIVTFAALGFAL